jgi:hypothetical protein
MRKQSTKEEVLEEGEEYVVGEALHRPRGQGHRRKGFSEGEAEVSGEKLVATGSLLISSATDNLQETDVRGKQVQS